MNYTLRSTLIVVCIAIIIAGCGSVAASEAAQPTTLPALEAVNRPSTPVANSVSALDVIPPTVLPNALARATVPVVPPQNAPGVIGQVISVDGSHITVQDPRRQVTLIVELTASTQVFKQTTVELANVPVGESISAIGRQEGDVFTAIHMRIGMPTVAIGPAGMAPPPFATPPPDLMTPRARMPLPGELSPPAGSPPIRTPRPPGGNMPPFPSTGKVILGTVQQVSGDTITVQAATGATVRVRLDPKGKIVQQIVGTGADITIGEQVIVMGEQNEGNMTATRIEIVPEMAPRP
jgi:hypothetical protein